MKIYNLNNFTKGWFVGDFLPTIISSSDVEVAIKKYQAGDKEEAHFHKVATEITAVVSGQVKMNELVINEGEIVLIATGEIASFECITNAITVVVKLPSVNDDKYLIKGTI
jgi:hypothetical protein